MRNGLILVLTLIFSGFGVRAADPPKKDQGDDLARWIGQLGSRRHRERESAVTALIEQRSPKALALLRQAAVSGDLDTRRRAQELLTHLERALESERLLQAQVIRLEFKDVPVTDALADYTRRTGIRLSLAESDKAKLATRKVTLDTGDVSYWEALTQLYQKAGLSEEAPKLVPVRDGEDREDLGWGRRRFGWSGMHRRNTPTVTEFVLVDSVRPRPTFHAGALRIQAVPAPILAGPPAPEVTLTLGVDVEPRFNWSRLVSVRIDHAVDALGQKLTQPAMFVGDIPRPPAHWDEMVIMWDGMEAAPQAGTRQGKVKLQRGEKFSSTLKEVRGTLSAEVETPLSPLVTIPDILKGGGQTFRGADGSSVRVLEIQPDADQYRLKIEVRLPPPPPAPQVPMWALPQAVVPAGGSINLNGAETEQKGLALYDAQGQPFLLATGSHPHTDKPESPVTYTLFYQPRKEQGPPVKFVLSGRRTVVLEVPFVLKDVPVR